jgi:hypothetical protein
MCQPSSQVKENEDIEKTYGLQKRFEDWAKKKIHVVFI